MADMVVVRVPVGVTQLTVNGQTIVVPPNGLLRVPKSGLDGVKQQLAETQTSIQRGVPAKQ